MTFTSPLSRRGRRAATAAVLAAAAVLAGSALAASNNVDASNAGQGVDVVAGFDVTGVNFNADPTSQPDGTKTPEVTSVSFDVARSGAQAAVPVEAANASVFVQLKADAGSATWATCKVGTGATAGKVSCPTSGTGSLPVADVDGLSVVAYDS